jgi:uncharacterized membrane protein YfcA
VFILPNFYFMDFQIGLVIAGLIVGFIVGITGVGGGSLMTPYYGLVFRQPAVGTDLLYAAFTKMGGVYVHHKKIILMGNYSFLWVVSLRRC